MESFIYSEINLAIREQDKSQIQYYGAFCSALSYILYSANKQKQIKN